MECRYCGTRNTGHDHRCNRCGRRIESETARAYPEAQPVISSAAIPKSVMAPAAPEVREERPPEESRPRAVWQPSLFREQPRVIPFDSIAPERADLAARKRAMNRTQSGLAPAEAARPMPRPIAQAPAAEPEKPAPKPAPKHATRVVKADFKKVLEETQRSLNFPPPARTPSSASSTQPVITIDAPVATPVHRILATLLDLSMMAIGLGVFAAVFHFAGGEIELNPVTIPIFCAIPLLIGIVYKTLYCIANGDSSGLQWTHLQLRNFEGMRLTRRERFARMAGGCLSFMAVGLGILWALTDEEKLTWHDHMSNTFPTPRD